MRFAGLLAAFTAAYALGTAVMIAVGALPLGEGIARTLSIAGAFAVGWILRGGEVRRSVTGGSDQPRATPYGG